MAPRRAASRAPPAPLLPGISNALGRDYGRLAALCGWLGDTDIARTPQTTLMSRCAAGGADHHGLMIIAFELPSFHVS
jgi:hypothetical protein